jgi:hypothetical protein
MGALKRLWQENQEEEQALYECLLDYLAENEELFRELAIPTPEEVIGYEE